MPGRVKKIEMNEEHCREHKRKKGFMILILGLLILGNASWMVVGWDVFIGLVLSIAGLCKLLMPHKNY